MAEEPAAERYALDREAVCPVAVVPTLAD